MVSSSVAPLLDLVVRFVYDAGRSSRHIHTLDQIGPFFVDLYASLNVLRRAKWYKRLGSHITELTVRADEVGTPGRG